MSRTDKSFCRSRRGHLATVVLVTLLLWVVGCDDLASRQQTEKLKSLPDPKLGFIAFVGAGQNDPVWPILKAGAEQYLNNGAGVEIRFFCPAGDSPRNQIELLNTLRDPNMRGLCLQISDTYLINPMLHKFFNDGVQIVSMIRPAPERVRVAHVGFDEEEVGRAIAHAAVQVLEKDSSVMLLHAGYDDPVYSYRLIGFDNGLKDNPPMDILARLDCKADPREARRIISERAVRYPRLSAWVALDDWPLRDTPDLGEILSSGCKFITFGGTPAQWPLLRNGISPIIVAANYRELGTKAAMYCELAINDPSENKNVYHAPLRNISPTNLDQYIRDWTYWSTGTRTSGQAMP